ncbi:MAG: TonB-dependent receptor [Lewinellaceae bacterium]|nr:TonB-dependent receptor [Phaeodactylibacter sp.]MCB9039285.1 TonB-dependent receptor [Lewinellaceae bacterium]
MKSPKTWVALLLLFPIMAFGQEANPLQQKISFETGRLTASEALKVVEMASGYTLAYSSALLPDGAAPLALSAREEPLEAVLRRIFQGRHIRFEVIGKRIHILEDKSPPPSRQTINGYIRDEASGEALIGATLQVKELPEAGTTTNVYGFFALTLPPGTYHFRGSYIGYSSKEVEMEVQEDKRVDIALEARAEQLAEVVVWGRPEEEQVVSTAMGKHRLDVQQLKTLPAIGGEPDVLKMAQMLPGVKSVGEGSSGLYVRGGNIDQNLILLDEAPVYNPAHLLGFFSAFNADAIRHMELYKAGFPVEYGGRLSSVVDLRMKEGNKEQFGMEGGIGLLAARLHLEGPVQKDKSSFMISGRRTYPDIYLLLSSDNGGNKVNFYDANAKLNFKLNENNHLFLSGYFGRDVFRFFDQYENNWGNTTGTLRWNHIFSANLFANFSFIYSRYDYYIENFIEGVTTFNWESGVEDLNAKAGFSWYLRPGSRLKFGANAIVHRFEPGRETEGRLLAAPAQKALETALYLGHEWTPNERLALEYGLRFSLYQNFGKTTIYQFDNAYQLKDSTRQGGGFYHHFYGLSPRINLRYQLAGQSSLKASYSRTVQYQQELRNAINSFSAFYIWMPSGPNIPMQSADQISVGYFHNFQDNTYEFSLETYYKWLDGQVDFADHAALIQNPYLEGEVRRGNGRAYGVEVMLARRKGRLQGWLSYAYSRTFRTIAGINNGREYPAYYDIPHEAELVLQYEVSPRWLFSANWQYTTGKAVNLPIGSFQQGETIVPIYGERNGRRLPDYHRLDLSATLKAKPKPNRRNGSYWVFSLYNAYYRKNALSVDLLPVRDRATGNVPDPTDVRATKTYIFGLIPSISYNFKF